VLRCHDTHAKFGKEWFTHSKVNRGNSLTHRQDDHISLLFFLKNKESRLKTESKGQKRKQGKKRGKGKTARERKECKRCRLNTLEPG
jgi:hypothetical protein